jgi:uncharacterized protein YdhG (YjbR/CyaY superfamily)
MLLAVEPWSLHLRSISSPLAPVGQVDQAEQIWPAPGRPVFTAEERAALAETSKERKAARAGKSDGEADVLAKIAEMPVADRRIAKRIHALIKDAAPELSPKTWYGMPAYANAEGKVICFFLAAAKFKSRYATFGFEEAANLDDGTMWPASFALQKLSPANEALIVKLVKKAARQRS